jgi:hypothetical protein
MALDKHPHHRMKGTDADRVRLGDDRAIYDFARAKAPSQDPQENRWWSAWPAGGFQS